MATMTISSKGIADGEVQVKRKESREEKGKAIQFFQKPLIASYTF